MGFKTGLLIGVLATAVVALGVVVVLLASESNGSGSGGTTAATTANVVGPPCKFRSMGGAVEIELGSEEVGCAEARGIYSEFNEAVRSGEASGIGKATQVAGWSCEEFPLAEYPLMARCRRGSDRFAVVGLAPAAHLHQRPTPAPSKAEPVFFQTPSGNIGCVVQEDGVRCDIARRDWSPPPKPQTCNLDWAHGVELHRNGPTFTCAGDTALSPKGKDAYPVLAYGEAVADGSFICESTTEKLVCANVQSKHGFWLSIQEVKLF